MAKKFPKFNQRQIVNFASGDETWAHYFEPVSDREMSTEKALYAIFFSCDGCQKAKVSQGNSVVMWY